MTLVPTGLGGDATTAEFSGTIHRGDNPGATDLEVRLDPLDYGVLEAIWPEARDAGTGSGTLELDGRADEGLVVVADFTHSPGTSEPHLPVASTAQTIATGARLSLQGQGSDLSVTGEARQSSPARR